MTNMRINNILFAAALAVTSLNVPAHAEPLKIRAAWSSLPAHMLPAIFLAKDGLRHYGQSYVVEPQAFQATTPMITAMAAKQIDVSVFAPTAMAVGVTNANLDIKVIGDNIQDGVPGYRQISVFVKSGSGIEKVEDLKGKRIGVNAIGSTSQSMIVVMLRKRGMDEKRDVQFVEVSLANQLPMIDDGKVDAVTQIPDDLVKAGKYKVLFDWAQAMGRTQGSFLAVRTDFLKENRAALLDFTEDYLRSLRWFYNPANHAAAVKLVAEWARRPAADLDYMFTKADYYRDPNLMPDIAGLQRVIDTSFDLGALKQKIEVAPYVDLSLVEEAKKRIEANP